MRRSLLRALPLLVLTFLLAAFAVPALAQVKEGARVPIPGQGEEGKTYTCQNRGLNLHGEPIHGTGRSVRVHGRLEDSSLQGTSAPPIFRTWTHDLSDIVVTEGKPLEAAAFKADDVSSAKLVGEIDILD